jgi:hypothetical protein
MVIRRCVQRFCGSFAVAVLVGGAVWAGYELARTRAREAPGEPAATSARAAEKVQPPPVAPLQLHLIPRAQPTPLSPSYQPRRPQE